LSDDLTAVPVITIGPQQAEENCAVADLPAISSDTMEAVKKTYDQQVREQVHYRW
jgi:hypothetical protein